FGKPGRVDAAPQPGHRRRQPARLHRLPDRTRRPLLAGGARSGRAERGRLMNCGCGPATFRLLDPYIGWHVSGPSPNLVGFDAPAGVQLEPAGGADLIDAT